jgi:Zn-dependent protease/CBS domain-containing protein
MNSNIRIGSLFGIPFYLNPSWFFVLAFVTWTYGSGLAAQFPALPAGVPLVLGLVTALLLFASVLAHELGHSVVALRQGIGVQSITLFLFGGLASLEKESKTPADAFWVAIAGPMVSLGLFGILTLMGTAIGVASPLVTILSVLASVNLALALFNLIPGLPLDGGNILKAAVWKLTGNPFKGVVIASRVGQLFGWVAIASGLLPLLLFGSFSNIWNLLIGGFLLQNAGQAAQFATVQAQFAGLTAADAITPDSPIVSNQLSLREFADQQILSANSWRKFLVTNSEGQLLGEFVVDDLKAVPSDRWADTQIGQLMHPVEPSQMIPSDQPLLDVAKLLEEQHLSALTVIQDNGILVGLLEKASILRLLQQVTSATPA